MHKEIKRLLVLGVILCLAGAGCFFWVFTERQKQQKYFSQEHEIYAAKLDGIKELAETQGEISPFKGIISDAISSEKPKDITESSNDGIIFYVSIVTLFLGTIILLSLFLLWLTHSIVLKISNYKKNFAELRKNRKKAGKTLIESSSQRNKRAARLTQKLYEPAKIDPNFSCTDNRKFRSSASKDGKQSDSIRPDVSEKFFADKTDFQVKPVDHLEDKLRDVILSSYQENAMKAQNSFKEQTKKLEKQVAEIKDLTQSITQVSSGGEKPSGNNIGELAEQIAAIRDYASSQQDRVTKLQEGYDWNIIRTFCLRIIRSIDNIDSRILDVSQHGGDSCDLEDIKDDLVFALESSGVEQFEPDISSDYSSSQKIAEAVKERKSCDETEMKGKIAEIIKPGYRYVIDEDNAKVVRAAQVKLFG